jgi:hypothetical protein
LYHLKGFFLERVLMMEARLDSGEVKLIPPLNKELSCNACLPMQE